MMLWPEAMDARTYHASTRARARESKRVRQHFRLHVLGLARHHPSSCSGRVEMHGDGAPSGAGEVQGVRVW